MDFALPPADLPSTKPYLVRAIWEWCADNGFTPYLAVDVDASCRVPQEFVKNGQIVFNIGPEATQNLEIDNACIVFQARFGGVPRDVYVPMARVAAVYARENGAGMAFPVEETDGATPPPAPEPPPVSRPRLQRVK
jgi:stringent starvation protein B